MGLPILGICYGHQLIVDRHGGRVKRANKEYGSAQLRIDDAGDLLGGIGDSVKAWMSHGDEAEAVPSGIQGYRTYRQRKRLLQIVSEERPVYGIQFHPEVAHTEKGTGIISNFVLDVCRAGQEWTMEGFVEEAVRRIAGIEGNVLCGVSGGIDSTVAALIIHRAIGDRLKCVFVNNGLLRMDEETEVERMFQGTNFAVKLYCR